MIHLHRNLQILVKRSKKTFDEIAKDAGIARSTLFRYMLKDGVNRIDIKKLQKLCLYFQVSAHDMLYKEID